MNRDPLTTTGATMTDRIDPRLAALTTLAIGTPVEGGFFAGHLTMPDGVYGIYAGVITAADGAPYALVLLSDKPARDLPWRQAMDWAEGLGAALPTRPEAAMLFANTPQAFEKRWHWTSAQYSARTAWCQDFGDGYQNTSGKGLELRARAVRRLPI